MIHFKPRKSHIIIIAIVLLVATGGYYYVKSTPNYASAVSNDIRSVADFTIHMPNKLPDGFTLKKDSIAYRQNVLFVQMVKGDQTILMSQQEKPNSMPPISSLKGFSELPVKIGYAVTGEQEGTSAVIVSTDDSIITITGGETVSRADLGLVAQQLESIK